MCFEKGKENTKEIPPIINGKQRPWQEYNTVISRPMSSTGSDQITTHIFSIDFKNYLGLLEEK